MYQSTQIIGNVGRDPEFRYTPAGIAVCNFSVCVNKKTGKGDDAKEVATWFNVTVWRERAETASKYIKKGMKIFVVGEIKVSAYIDKSNNAVGRLELTASDFKFLDSKPEGSAQGGYSGGGSDVPPGDDYEPADIPF